MVEDLHCNAMTATTSMVMDAQETAKSSKDIPAVEDHPKAQMLAIPIGQIECPCK